MTGFDSSLRAADEAREAATAARRSAAAAERSAMAAERVATIAKAALIILAISFFAALPPKVVKCDTLDYNFTRFVAADAEFVKFVSAIGSEHETPSIFTGRRSWRRHCDRETRHCAA
jgi:hypothetical protein